MSEPSLTSLGQLPALLRDLFQFDLDFGLYRLLCLKRREAHREKVGDGAYRLSYLARLPLEANASMLNLAALEDPFRYAIEVLTDGGPSVETVDLVETFNFRYGLHVERLETRVNDKDKRCYRNEDTATPSVKSLDPLFKRLIEEREP